MGVIMSFIILCLEKVLQTDRLVIQSELLQNVSFDATLFNIDGTESTDGVWNGGMTIAEAAGKATQINTLAATWILQMKFGICCFATQTPALTHCIFPRLMMQEQLQLIGNAQVGNGSMDNMRYNNNYQGVLRRLEEMDQATLVFID